MYSLGAWCSKKSNLALFNLAWRQRYDEFFYLYFILCMNVLRNRLGLLGATMYLTHGI